MTETMPKEWIEACRERDEVQAMESPTQAVPSRAARLMELETTVRRGLREFTDAGWALMKIRDDKLYREAGYSSFRRYAKDRFGIGKSHAYRLMKEAILVAEMSPAGDGLVSERQARELARLPAAELPGLLDWVVAQGGFAKVSGPQIAERVDWILAERAHERIKPARDAYDRDIQRNGPNHWMERPISSEALRLRKATKKELPELLTELRAVGGAARELRGDANVRAALAELSDVLTPMMEAVRRS